jgi:dUTP pyrophosphatase
MLPKLRYAKIHPNAQAPFRKPGKKDVGFDLAAIYDGVVLAGQTTQVEFGIRVVLPEGYWAYLRPRSSQGKLGLNSGTGVIDEGYVGPLGYYLTNESDTDWAFKQGDKVGQLILIKMPDVDDEAEEINEDQIPQTMRGSTGFGDSGGASWRKS